MEGPVRESAAGRFQPDEAWRFHRANAVAKPMRPRLTSHRLFLKMVPTEGVEAELGAFVLLRKCAP